MLEIYKTVVQLVLRNNMGKMMFYRINFPQATYILLLPNTRIIMPRKSIPPPKRICVLYAAFLQTLQIKG